MLWGSYRHITEPLSKGMREQKAERQVGGRT